ncbi:purine-nucleoside phosphorylase [Granulicella rosea]|uniref:Purine nucleoside phosphorylase n=1 Tax=Granulicella rosea TaxID=474952 RepID=A0A239DWN1_9BACT|nr:purine-nucleoside phosphorylase [Granulicella rosea]SNS36679.1 purine-nucleoside phosphorylase [Granulicella rosea]
MTETLDLFAQATAAVAHIRALTPIQPVVGIILGSGLGSFGTQVENPTVIPYAEIPHFPRSTVVGHSGNLILGTIGGVAVAVLQGRAHAYEGHAMSAVTFPTRVLGLLGIRTLVVTNAAGGINTAYRQGSIVGISDHINLTGMNAASGVNEPRFATHPGAGQRFFDMTTAYSPRLQALAIEQAAIQGYDLMQGVYLAVLGPSFETAAEIRAFRALGADLVGMSTVHEVIVARHMGIEVLGFSLVTNMAAGVLPVEINHDDVLGVGRGAEAQFTGLLTAIIPKIPA